MSLTINNLTVHLDKNLILDKVHLDVRDGELVSLLGPSGCGKSTLLKSVAGLLDITEGEIYIDDQRIDGLAPHRRGAVVVFQDLRLFTNMNVVDNVAFSLRMQGMGKEERIEKAEHYLEKVQLAGMEKRKVSQLSGGQQQRVALARALAANPKVLLLDEPFSSLDEDLREDMRQLLTHLHKELGNTIVLVTHDRQEALQLSDRIVVMEKGGISHCATKEQ